jgi:hypothetical protein
MRLNEQKTIRVTAIVLASTAVLVAAGYGVIHLTKDPGHPVPRLGDDIVNESRARNLAASSTVIQGAFTYQANTGTLLFDTSEAFDGGDGRISWNELAAANPTHQDSEIMRSIFKGATALRDDCDISRGASVEFKNAHAVESDDVLPVWNAELVRIVSLGFIYDTCPDPESGPTATKTTKRQ